MNKLTSFAAAVLIGILPGSAWSDEAASLSVWPDETPSITVWQDPKPPITILQDEAPSTTVWPEEAPAQASDTAARQTPAPASGVVSGGYVPVNPGGYVPTWQHVPRWPVPQPVYGYVPPRYPPVGHYQAYPVAPASAPAAMVNPLSAELKKTEEQLTAKTSELETAHRMLEQLRDSLQKNFAAERTLSEEMAHKTREQQALQVRVTELGETLSAANTTLEQQHQLINTHQVNNKQLTAERDQLHAELASRGEQLAALQAELQAANQALMQARSRADAAIATLNAVRIEVGVQRDGLSELETELQREVIRLQGERQGRTE